MSNFLVLQFTVLDDVVPEILILSSYLHRDLLFVNVIYLSSLCRVYHKRIIKLALLHPYKTVKAAGIILIFATVEILNHNLLLCVLFQI